MDSAGTITDPPRRPPPQAASAALVSAVLGNDDILREILIRLDFPTSLVRAAAVCKRWLRHASDPALLRRFRRLHPPRLLGFYLNSSEYWMRFMPLPQPPPELAAVIRRGRFDLGGGAGRVSDCRNGRLIVSLKTDDHGYRKTVCRPLHPERGGLALPPRGGSSLPLPYRHGGLTYYAPRFLFRDDGGDDEAISAVSVTRNAQQVGVQLHEFQAGAWSECRNSDLRELPGRWTRCKQLALLANGKIYMICMERYILVLDVQSMSLFSIELPNGVEYEYEANIALSRTEGSGFCLVHVTKFQISVWRYTMDCSSTGNWELIDTICLRQVFGPNADPNWWSQGADVRVAAVGDNAHFMFFRIQKKVFHLHIPSRTVEKVYELAQDESLYGVCPFMMVWPPTFPTLNGGHDKDD